MFVWFRPFSMSFKAKSRIILASGHRKGVTLPDKFESLVVITNGYVDNDTVATILVRPLERGSPAQTIRRYNNCSVRVEVQEKLRVREVDGLVTALKSLGRCGVLVARLKRE
jgi:hypothetical protein